MSEYRATVEWQLQGEFSYESYSRAHSIDFGHDLRLPGNAAPGNIPKAVQWTPGADPEQQFVASLRYMPHALVPARRMSRKVHGDSVCR